MLPRYMYLYHLLVPFVNMFPQAILLQMNIQHGGSDDDDDDDVDGGIESIHL